MSDDLSFWAKHCAPWLRARRAFLFTYPLDTGFWIGTALGLGFGLGRFL